MQPDTRDVTVAAMILLILVCPWCAQGQTPVPLKLQILIIGGEGSINNIKQRTAREPIVEVRDENNRPVAGAIVLFEAPERGASGVFLNGSRTTTVTTDANGQAVGRDFKPNQSAGDMQMTVTASLNGLTASTVIRMRNAGGGGGPGLSSGTKLTIVALAVAAAVVVGYAASNRQQGPSTVVIPPSITITPGAGTVGLRP